MDIRVLRYFLAIIKEGSITQAAHHLHLTQPTISRQIKELEEELGHALFVRRNKGQIELTPEGHLLQNRAEEIIAMVDKTESEFQSLSDSISGDVFIGAGETKAFTEIAQIARELQASYPNIHYQLTSGNAEDILTAMDKGLLDFAVIAHPKKLARYNYLKLASQDEWGVLLPLDHPLTEKEAIKQADLENEPLILSRQALTHTQSDSALLDWLGDPEKLQIIATFNLVFNALFMVEQGLGVMITFDQLTHSDQLTFRPLSPRLTSDQYLVFKKDKIHSPAARLFLNSLMKNLH